MGKNARFSGTRHGKQFWVEEKQNFGAKYLARMGWKPGEGLGDNGSGLKKCIGIVRKNDSVGIGGKHTNVKKHQAIVSMFNDILKKAGKPKQKKAKNEPSLNVDQYIAKSELYRRFVRAKIQDFDYLKENKTITISAPEPSTKKSKKKKKSKIKIDSEFRKQMAKKFKKAGKFGMGSADTVSVNELEEYANTMNELAQMRKKKQGLGFGKPVDEPSKTFKSPEKKQRKKKKKKRRREADEDVKKPKKKRKLEGVEPAEQSDEKLKMKRKIEGENESDKKSKKTRKAEGKLLKKKKRKQKTKKKLLKLDTAKAKKSNVKLANVTNTSDTSAGKKKKKKRKKKKKVI